MAQIESGVRSILALPQVYRLFQNTINKNINGTIANEYLKLKGNENVLDIGCGPADILASLPSGINYTGLDLSQDYIDFAKNRYPNVGRFICQNVSDIDVSEVGEPDVVLLLGVLHHLEVEKIEHIFSSLKKISTSSTRVFTIDPCYTQNQNFIAKKLIDMDRGLHVKNQSGYEALVKKHSKNLVSEIRTDLLRLPYTQLIMQFELKQ